MKLWSVRAYIRIRIVSSCTRRSHSGRDICIASVGTGSLGPWPRIASPVFTLLPCLLVLSVKFVGSFASLDLLYRPRLLQSFVVASLIDVSVPFLFARYVRRHSRRVFVGFAVASFRSFSLVIVAP